MKKKLYYLLMIFSMLLLQLETTYAQTITVDLTKNHQLIRGFGGMNHTSWIGDLNEDVREKAFGNDPGEMGLSILRIHLDPNPDQFNLELPTALYAQEKGALVFATPWNAPEALLDPDSELSRLLPSKYGAYVDHLNGFNTFMAENGAPLYAISVQNEPDYGEWTRWTAAEMLDFMEHHAQNIENRVMAPESFQFRRTFSDPLLNSPEAAANLDIVGGHIYGGGLSDYPLAREKGKEVWMTEHLLGSREDDVNDWSLALRVGKEINDCMKANFNAYVWWYIRRFYGLITDDGNISDKGYVMGQYAKFITPGAVRVEVDDNAADMLDVTAYKTDTSFVMVVVNRNIDNTNLTFNIPGANFEKLTQFTSSEIKKVVNDGETTVSGGSFTATIDARSVTTFTTHPEAGGKSGNIAPLASAGPDLELSDEQGQGGVAITLNGSESQDPDGEIVNYSWAQGGQQISWEAEPEVIVGVGDHEFVLTVTDNDGARSMDTVNIAVTTLNNAKLWLEAECTEVGDNWDTHTSQDASKGEYLMVKVDTEAVSEPSANTADHLVYSFDVPEDGNYTIWGRVLAPSPDDDSFWVRVDDGEWLNWNNIQGGSDWQWDEVHNASGTVMIYPFTTGSHTLTFSFRENGAGIDKLYLTNTGLEPSALGDDAENCETIPTRIRADLSNTVIRIFPNPARSVLHVESEEPFHSLVIYHINGSKIMEKTFSAGTTTAELPIDFDRGIYVLKVVNGNQSFVQKLLVD